VGAGGADGGAGSGGADASTSAPPPTGPDGASPATPTGDSSVTAAAGKIQHIVIIMQENRSFDHYFGTFPGAEGIPMDANGAPTVCSTDPTTGTCVKPYHNTADKNLGGPHASASATTCINGGKMDGFIANAGGATNTLLCLIPNDPGCAHGKVVDVMGYHTDAEVPNYWAYAKNFTLQDHMFQPNASWSYPQHLFMVSGWSAHCSKASDVSSCTTNIDSPGIGPILGSNNYLPTLTAGINQYPWTDITYLLHKAGISWRYYLGEGPDPHCGSDPEDCQPTMVSAPVPSIWNVLPGFDTVKEDGETGNVVPIDEFYEDVTGGKMPSVAWIAPANTVSEHPTSLVSEGQAYVTALINTIMKSKEWATTAIFLSWDDWGGFYDHVPPPKVDGAGYGLRVPGLTISPWVKKGFIDKQVLSHDAYLRFIEDVFLGGQRLDPKTDGRPDPRPNVRESAAQLGDLMKEFDFNQQPLPPLYLEP
jgi:phospholipase C